MDVFSGVLNPLDCPHHMRTSEDSLFREGVVLDKPVKPGKGSFVNVGLLKVRNTSVVYAYWSLIVGSKM